MDEQQPLETQRRQDSDHMDRDPSAAAKLDHTDVTLHSTTVTPLTTVVDLGVHVDN